MRQRLKNHFIPHEGNDYKPHAVRSQTLIFTLMLGFGILVMAMLGSRTVPGISGLADVQSTYLAQVTNEKRNENKIGELRVNPLLQEAAQLKAQDMIANQYFAHVSPEGKQPWYWMNQVGYKYKYAGENLAIDFYDTQEVAEAWMNSPTHRRNILNGNYTEIGIAVDSGKYKGRNVAFVVQMFGSPRFASPDIQQTATLAVNNEDEIARQIASLRERIEQREQAQIEAPEEASESQVLGQETVAEDPDRVVLAQGESQASDNEILANETVTESTEDKEGDTVEYVVTTNEGSFIETVYEGGDQVPEDSTLEQDEELNPVLVSVSRPIALGQTILLVLMSLIGISLVLKIFIEIKKQHWKNVILAVLILVALGLIYIILDQQMGQVTIL